MVRVVVTAAAVSAAALVAAAAPAAGRSSDATLLTRHSPVLIFHPAELFAPRPVEGFVADSDLLARSPDGTWAPATVPLASAGAATRLDQRLCMAIDGPLAEQCYADAERAHAGTPTAYGSVFRRSGKIVLQYWLWYPVNTYSPTVPAGPFWINHEGDWESVTVILDTKERPQLVGLSSHCGGQRRAWSAAPRKGTHPVAYVAKGSHANYFTAGVQRADALDAKLVAACFTSELVAIYKAYKVPLVDHTARGRTVRPRVVPVTATAPGWMRFRGTWGEDRYIGFPDVDPFRNGAGPVGPAFHAQWRRPLSVPLAWPVG
jgi:hypothetical protein